MYVIYGLKAVGCDQLKYIGATSRNINRRMSEHITQKSNNSKKDWINSVEGKIEAVVIEDGLVTEKDAHVKEIFYIKLFKAMGATLTNMNAGGRGAKGMRLSEEIKSKIRAANTGKIQSIETRQKRASKMIGKPQSDKKRYKCSISKLGDRNPYFGKNGSEHNRSIKVDQIDMNGNLIKTWDSMLSAKKELKIGHISSCVNGTRNSAGGFQWRKHLS